MNLSDPALYNNRELSWLEFNERVLEEAIDKTNPLMERLKFLAISASNLDEFFMVRVSSIMRNESDVADASGMLSGELLSIISKRVQGMIAKQYSCFTRSILPALEKEGIRFLDYAELCGKQKEFADKYFNDVLYQVLTPMAIDQSRPFPAVNNRTVNIFIELEGDKDAQRVRGVKWVNGENRWEITDERPTKRMYAVVQVPTVVSRIVRIDGNAKDYILLENIILAHIQKLFPGHVVLRTSLVRVTRNSDIDIHEEEVEDLLDEMARSLRGRRWGVPVRMDKSRGMGKAATKLLEKGIGLSEDKFYEISGPPDLSAWLSFATLPEFSHLRHAPIKPSPVAAFLNAPSMFEVIRKNDVLVHHPYMSFDCVTRFIQEAAEDPRVLAIKQTLYRVSGKSPIINALIKAAENGKQVSVLVELKARFDEENNIHWAKLMEKSGIHVIYGLIGLKTHCKLCLVVRREDDAIRRYMHLSTGNYNESTAKIYTDLGLFTCRETFGQDTSVLFNVLTGYSKITDWQKFAVAPTNLRQNITRLIENECKNAAEKKPASITARMNSLTDIEMIQTLYRASQAGVKIRLLVRGTCCLKPGISGISDNITVSSIIDRYLEHSRVFIFENGGRKRVFLSSADLMSRNLNRRVEVMFPIEDKNLQQQVISIVETSLADNVKRRKASPDGTYEKISRRGKEKVHSQLEHHRAAADSKRAEAPF
ncbi:MAG: polyphosphate kinase 1 [Defluviitaleaceae bacterium]|nr:polyphosphate kinase 1 [Defluviitaleaceae bacterium]